MHSQEALHTIPVVNRYRCPCNWKARVGVRQNVVIGAMAAQPILDIALPDADHAAGLPSLPDDVHAFRSHIGQVDGIEGGPAPVRILSPLNVQHENGPVFGTSETLDSES